MAEVVADGGGWGGEARRPPPAVSSHASSSSNRAPESRAIRTSARRSWPTRAQESHTRSIDPVKMLSLECVYTVDTIQRLRIRY